MKRFDRSAFNGFVLKNKVIGFFNKPLELKSGRLSYWYVNWRTLASDVFLLDRLTDYIISFVKDLGLSPDCFYGVPEGATKMGVIAQYKSALGSPNYGPGRHALPMGRGKPKGHGAPGDMYFLGAPRGNTVVLEDVTTTGDSLLSTIEEIQGVGANVLAAIALTDRMALREDGRSVKEAVESKGIAFHSLSRVTQLLPEAFSLYRPGEEIARAIEREFEEYGVEKVTVRK